jgi:hypothetical protein
VVRRVTAVVRRGALWLGLLGLGAIVILSVVPLQWIGGAFRGTRTLGLSFVELRFLGYFLLAVVLGFAVSSSRARLSMAFALTGLSASLELAQHWIPNHHPQLWEFLHSIVAIAVGISVAYLFAIGIEARARLSMTEQLPSEGPQRQSRVSE